MTLEFWATALVVAASPGTGVLYTLAAGLAHGRRASLIAAFGCTLGIVPHVAAALTGLAALMHASALAFATLKYAGVAYLLFMAWRMLADRDALSLASQTTARTARAVIGEAVLINLLNPKLTIFFVAFLPQFVAPGDAHAVATMTGLSGAFMAVTFAVFALYGLAAASVRRTALARPRLVDAMRRLFAGAFLLLGLRLALAER
jgi:threonine/homoserine/homoserine lactone efflux protein